MPIVEPVPIPAAPPAPQRNDPETFEERNDAAVEYQFNTLPGAIDQQSEATYQNALAAEEQAIAAAAWADEAASTIDTVEGFKNDAAASASSAAADAVKTAADRQVVEQALIDGPVLSVNGETGVVALGAEEVGAARADLSNVSQTDARNKVGTGTMAYRDLTISTEEPSGTVPGQVWFQVES